MPGTWIRDVPAPKQYGRDDAYATVRCAVPASHWADVTNLPRRVRRNTQVTPERGSRLQLQQHGNLLLEQCEGVALAKT